MQTMPKKGSRCALVLEVLIDSQSPPKWVQIVTSMPGRDGAVTRTWGLSAAGFDAPTTLDLETWINRTLQDLAILAAGGVQGVLLPDPR